MPRILLILALASATPLMAQQSTSSSGTVDSPNEIDKLRASCFNLKGIPGCAEELFTGKPIHIAVGSIAPQNGFGVGLAYVGHKTTDNWRTSWDADAVASRNESWRAGVYVKFVHTPDRPLSVSYGTPPPAKANLTELPEHTIFGIYAQTISLNKLAFFGLGPSTTRSGRSFYGMTETVVGGNVVKPFYSRLNASMFGEINGRFVSLRASSGQASPSIEQLYTDTTAPGLTSHPGTFQAGEGIRIRPVLASDVVRLNYSLSYQQFWTPSNSSFSFQRLNIDLRHEFAIYGKTTRLLEARLANGPDDCALDPVTQPQCPKPFVRNFEGTVGLRFLTALSMTPSGNEVPFYFQPTLGGSDTNGNLSLSSYQDYRFRARNILLFRESLEHSIWNLPIGFTIMADEGKVALTRGALGASRWLHSFSTGLTLRAGGFPQVSLLFSWGGPEGTHTIGQMNTSLLGASNRPQLY